MTISPTKSAWTRLEFRILNALDDDSPTVTGQVLGEGVESRLPRSSAAAVEKARSLGADFNTHARPASPWRGPRGNVVWLRQHFLAKSLDRPGWPGA